MGRSETGGEDVSEDALPANAPPDGAAFLRRWLAQPANVASLEKQLKSLANRAADFKRLGVDEAVRELLTEVCAEALGKASSFNPARPPIPYLMKFAGNICLRWRERAGKGRARIISLDEPMLHKSRFVAREGHERLVLNRDLTARLLWDLPDEDARLFRLHAFEERTSEEIGVLMNLSPVNARVRCMRIRKKLKERFEALETEEANVLLNKGGRG